MDEMPRPLRRIARPYWSGGDYARVYVGDCLEVLEGLPALSAHLAFADPPFNTGYGYDVYNDRRPSCDYIQWTSDWLRVVRRALTPEASIYVAIGVGFAAEMKLAIEEAGFYWRDMLVWHYTFGPAQKTRWTPSWVAIHYATLSSRRWTWNPDAVRVPSARQRKYRDKRANSTGKVPDNVWVLSPDDCAECFTPGSNVLSESRVCGTFRERTPHPCQMPLPILERIVAASSNEGDTVLDPFLGSGTTAVAAVQGGRRAVGIELSEAYVRDIVVPRLEGTRRRGLTRV